MNPKTRKEVLEERRRRAVDRIVASVSAVNRPDLEAHVEEERNIRRKELSIRSFVTAVAKADGILQKPFKAITVEDARQVVSGFRPIYSPKSLRLRVISWRKHVRWIFQVERLDEQDSPCRNGKAIERALRVPRGKMEVVGQVISREHQDRLVASIPKRNSRTPRFPMEVRDRWILRGLKAAGDRVSKFVALRLRDVRIERAVVKVNGQPTTLLVARLGLDLDAPDLKTATESITKGERYAWQHVEDLIAWLKVHPCVGANHRPNLDWSSFDGARDTDDPDAPLNLSGRCKTIQGLTPSGIHDLVQDACRWSGLDKELPALLTPHDFRHTGATEDARNGDNEFDLRLKYDWGPDSKMPGTYVHMDLDDMRRRAVDKAQAAAGRVAQGGFTQLDVNAAIQALQTLAQALQGIPQPAHPPPAQPGLLPMSRAEGVPLS